MGWRLSSTGKWLVGALGWKLCDCCEPAASSLYAMACPCESVHAGITPDAPEECNIPDAPCIFVDLRSTLDDDPGTLLAERIMDFWAFSGAGGSGYVGPTIIYGGHCYRFSYPHTLYADSATTDEEREALLEKFIALGLGFAGGVDSVSDLPGGATQTGGDGVELPTAEDCADEACTPWESSIAFYPAYACDGSELAVEQLVCTIAASQGGVFDCKCISRSTGYTAEEASDLALAGATLWFDPPWTLIWQKDGSGFHREPAWSCCYCTASECLTGRKWSNFGNDSQWWYEDVCCGKLDTLAYHVVLSYTRIVVQDNGGGDISTTTITCEIDDTFTSPSGTNILVTGTQVIRRQRPLFGIDTTEEGEVSFYVGAQCCLYPDVSEHAIPTVGTWTFPGPTFVDAWDGSTQVWGERTESTDPLGVINDLAYNLRLAWNITPWAAVGPVASVTETSDIYTGTGSCEGGCTDSYFRLDEDLVTTHGASETVSINLHVTKIEDDSSPCGYIGTCGELGWQTADAWELLP